MEADGFQIVKRNRGKRRPKQSVVLSDALTRSTALCNEDTHVDLRNLKRKIRLCWNEFAGSQFFAALTKNLDQAVQAATHKDTNTPQNSLSLSPWAPERMKEKTMKVLNSNPADMNSGPDHSEESSTVTQRMGEGLQFPSVEQTTVKNPQGREEPVEARQQTTVKNPQGREEPVEARQQTTVKNSQGREEREEEPVEARQQKDEDCAVSLVVYGLGNFASCLIARYQLALVLALRHHLQIAPGSCDTYDPKYTDAEKDILADLGFTVIDNNEEGKRCIQGATVVVMPHCGKALFNNLLWANWSPPQLQHLVVLGNSFSAMLDSIPRRLWQKHIGYIAKMKSWKAM